MTPEENAREKIDALVGAAGWAVQTREGVNLSAGLGVAIVTEVERRLSFVEELESVVSANDKRAAWLRQSILQKAFTENWCKRK